MTTPTPNQPDGFPNTPEGRTWISKRLAAAAVLVLAPAHATQDTFALEQIMEAQHALRLLMFDRRADDAGVVKPG